MSFIEFAKRNLMHYFIMVTCITIAIAVLGMTYDPGAMFSYEAYFSPLIFGAIAVLPSFVLYSKRELNLSQMLIRRILHFITLEIILLAFGFLSKLFDTIEVAISFAVSVFVIYLLTNVIMWILDSRTADKINEGLKKLQS